jgi:hypothetical protein
MVSTDASTQTTACAAWSQETEQYILPPGTMQHWLIPDRQYQDGMGSPGSTECIHISTLAHDEWLVDDPVNKDIIYTLWAEIGKTELDQMKEIIAEQGHLEGGCLYWSTLMSGEPQDTEILGVLSQFEEDFDFEHWLNDKQHINAIKDYNRHLFLSGEFIDQRDGWAGEIRSEDYYDNELWYSWKNNPETTSHTKHLLLVERYTMDVEILSRRVDGPISYAKGTTEYGDVYIPSKFAKYLPPIGATSMMTLVPQVFDGKGKCIPWKCIFQHDGQHY